MYLLEVATDNLGLEPFRLRVGLSCKENYMKSVYWQWDEMTERSIEDSFISYNGVIGLKVRETDIELGLTYPVFFKAWKGDRRFWYAFRTNGLQRSVYK